MATEKKLFSVQAELNDRDFEDIFRVYMRYERGNEKKIGLLVSIALFLACILLTFVLSRLTLLFYGIGCAVIGLSYYLVPVNRKFLATNKLQFGEKREISFYPHQVTTMELFDDDNDDEADGEAADGGGAQCHDAVRETGDHLGAGDQQSCAPEEVLHTKGGYEGVRQVQSGQQSTVDQTDAGAKKEHQCNQ